MKKKKGISLIVLIVTIIVIIILAAAVILTITKHNSIESAKEAVFKEDVRAFQDELNMYISKEYTNLQGQRDSKITAKGYGKDGEKDSVYTYVPDFKKKYEGKLAIKEDMIAYVGTDEKEKQWLLNSGVYMSKTLTVKYVDQDGNKLKEDTSIAVMDNYYSVDVPEIEGYIRFSEKLEGKISQDSEVIAEYYLENDNLAYMGLDASGKETTDEASIVAYEVTGIGECNVSKIAIPREHNGKSVTKIKNSAFSKNSTLTSVIIGDNIDLISSKAFYGTAIVQLSINASKIESYAFWTSSRLEKAILGKNVTSIIGGGIFLSCPKLNDLTILTENADIDNNVLQTKQSLKEIKVNNDNSKYMVDNGILYSKDESKIYAYPTGKDGETYIFPNSVKEIGHSAFLFCTNLKSIDIPSTVDKIGANAFYGTNIKEANINAKELESHIFYDSYSLEKVIIGENVTLVKDGLFRNCSKLNDLTILTENADIDNNVLQTKQSLKEIKVNNDNSKYMVDNGILYSKDESKIYAYPTGKDGETYIFPNSVKEIGHSAFLFCTNLKSIDIPSTVDKIGANAFYGTNIKEANINAKELESSIFYDSYSLENVTFGKNVTNFGSSIFINSNKIKSIKYLGTKEEWNNILKHQSWKNGNSSITKIICTDGEIDL